jgi:sugar O-acyltransferase (sialic acid O-acetyltransferase NeuD family)
MLKRSVDLSLSVLSLIVLFPVLIGISFLLFIVQGGPVLFTQSRVGFKGQIFKLYKFRTMMPLKEGQDTHSMDRLTWIGKIVRSWSLDELPSLFNIIKGEMSLVGPRPLLVHYLEKYNREQMRRHDALPGLTGWAQVNGRNALSWENKFKYDVWYVDHANFWLDMKIIFLTLKVMIIREGINATDSDIMEEFDPGLYVFGSGGHAKVLISSLQSQDMKVVGIFDDDPKKLGSSVLGVPVVGSVSDCPNFKVKKAAIGIGDNSSREKIANLYPLLNWISVVHPQAVVDSTVKIGKGSVVFAGVVINASAQIGDHAIINTSAVVDHDSIIGNFSHIGPGAVITGGVSVENNCLIGAGSKVIPGKSVGKFSSLGAGSVVIKNIPEFSVAVGVPAEIIDSTVEHIKRKKA